MHSKVLGVQLIIALVIGRVILLALAQTWANKFNDEWILLETIWTILPGLILVWLGAPSLTLLYERESLVSQPEIILKISGHQWYWSYNLPEFKLDFDSITVKTDKIFPLIEVSEKIVLPLNQAILILVTREDVIHSFALPSLGIKADANPGRLNAINLSCFTPGAMIGQCSELCGSLHRNITIYLEINRFSSFLNWTRLLTENQN